MAPKTKIFLTGSTGYIGGSVFHHLITSHPEYEFTVLLRTIPSGFEEKYPNVKIIRGDYHAAEVLSKAASEADIVIHCGNSDHIPATTALLAGIAKRTEPTFLIHLSGTATIADVSGPDFVPGRLNEKVWSDVDDHATITSFPDTHFHRPVDRLILAASKNHGAHIKTAIISPPAVYGPGLGPGKTQSYAVPFFLDDIPKFGNRTFYVNEGENTAAWTHIRDLTKLYQRLVEEAVAGGGKADWNENGFYFAPIHEDGKNWKTVAGKIGGILKAKGVIEDATPISVTAADNDKMLDGSGIGLYMYACNARIRADRARKLFGMEAVEPGVLDTLHLDVEAALKEKEKSADHLAKLGKGE